MVNMDKYPEAIETQNYRYWSREIPVRQIAGVMLTLSPCLTWIHHFPPINQSFDVVV